MTIVKKPELHLISDSRMTPEAFAALAAEIHPMLDGIHLRWKDRHAKELAATLDWMEAHGVPLGKVLVNDRADVAWAYGAGGVQLAWHSMEPDVVKQRFPELRVGRSVHSAEEAQEAKRQGADFVMYGHIYETGSKPGLPARGLGLLADVVRQAGLPVIAIGGIGPEQTEAVLQQGAAGIAVIAGICRAAHPAAAAAEYAEAIRLAMQAGIAPDEDCTGANREVKSR